MAVSYTSLQMAVNCLISPEKRIDEEDGIKNPGFGGIMELPSTMPFLLGTISHEKRAEFI